MKCPKCQFNNVSGVLYCGKCGTRLQEPENIAGSSKKTLVVPIAALIRGSLFAGRYEVIEEIGRGGMGAVFRVMDKKINEEVALKLLKPEIAAEKPIIERFKNELKLARKITHKNVCRMFDLNENDGLLYITMEYVSGEDLKSLIKRAGRLSIEKSISIASQICAGLAEAHGLGVVHRDLKPQNIMIDRSGNARIMDFGIARTIEASELTEAGVVIGTPHYISPEQIEGEDPDQRTDIYALGVILYEMVTGQLPFKADSALSLALKHKQELPRSPRDLNPTVPENLSRLIVKCLEKDREMRCQSAEDLFSALSNIQMEIGVTADISSEKIYETAVKAEKESLKSIAVLPFRDMSPSQDQSYFCEGLAEELINALTQIKYLKVASRTSSFALKGKDADIREIGKLLNVGSVLEGSIQKAGNQVRITAQLIGVEDGYHIWSQRFDRNMEDIFVIQDEISMAVVEKLKVELLDEEKARVTKRHTEDKDAYNLYLKGRYFWNRRYQGDMIRAVDFYQRAINKDPDYALPYVGIADVFNIMGQWAFIHPKDAYTRAKAMLQKALEIDDTLSEAYSSLGFLINGYEWDSVTAEAHFKRSIGLNPQNSYAHGWYAIMLGSLGRYEEAMAEAKNALESDPLFSLTHALYGVVLSICRRIKQGREQMLRAIAMDPEQPMPYLFLGIVYLMQPALPDEAIKYLEKAAGFGINFAFGWLGIAYAMADRKEDARKILDMLVKIEKESYLPPYKKVGLYLKPGLKHFRFMKKKYVAPFLRGLIYLGLNMQEKALDYYEKSSQARDFGFPFAFLPGSFDDLPWIEEFRSRPMYKVLQEKIAS